MKFRKQTAIIAGVLTGVLVCPLAQAGFKIKADNTSLNIGAQLRMREQTFPALKEDVFKHFANYRVRLNFDFRSGDNLRVFIQPQKVGVFGNNETGAAVDFGTPENFDFHQAFLDWKLPHRLDLRLGRFEQTLADQRLVGDFRWSQRGRSFDGARLTWGTPSNHFDVIAFQVAGEVNALTGGGPLPAGSGNSQNLYIFHWLNTSLLPRTRLELTYLRDNNLIGIPFSGQGALSDSERNTFGIFIARTDEKGRYLSPFYTTLLMHPDEAGAYWRGEAYGQTGNRGPAMGNQSIKAYMFSAQLGWYFGNHAKWHPLIWGGVDYLSGDKNVKTGDYGAFDTLYPTNHAYYGYMDYFLLSIPGDTHGYGLQDSFVSANFNPAPRMGLQFAMHNFRFANTASGVSSEFGNELDVTYAYKVQRHVILLFGYSHMFSGSGSHDLFAITSGKKGIKQGKNPNFLSAQVNVAF